MNLIMMIGIPGSGKSTIGKQIAQLFKYEYISSDEKREEWYGNTEDQTHNFELFCRLERLVTKMLEDGKDVVFDATNITRKSRKRFVELGKKENVSMSAVVVHTSEETAKRRNTQRERTVPDYVIERQFKTFQKPTKEEGFGVIFTIDNNEDKV